MSRYGRTSDITSRYTPRSTDTPRTTAASNHNSATSDVTSRASRLRGTVGTGEESTKAISTRSTPPLSSAASNVTARLTRKFEPASKVRKLDEPNPQVADSKTKTRSYLSHATAKAADPIPQSTSDVSRDILAARQKRYLENSSRRPYTRPSVQKSDNDNAKERKIPANDRKIPGNDRKIPADDRKIHGNDRKIPADDRKIPDKQVDSAKEKTPPSEPVSPLAKKAATSSDANDDRASIPESRKSPNRFGYMPSRRSFHVSEKDDERPDSASSTRCSVDDTNQSFIPRSKRTPGESEYSKRFDRRSLGSEIRTSLDTQDLIAGKLTGNTAEKAVDEVGNKQPNDGIRRSQLIKKIQRSYEQPDDNSMHDEVFADSETKANMDKSPSVEKIDQPRWRRSLGSSDKVRADSGPDPFGTSYLKKDATKSVETCANKYNHIERKKDCQTLEETPVGSSQSRQSPVKERAKTPQVENSTEKPRAVPACETVDKSKCDIDELKIAEKAERIRKYKEERRKQLSTMKDRFENIDSKSAAKSATDRQSPLRSTAKKVDRHSPSRSPATRRGDLTSSKSDNVKAQKVTTELTNDSPAAKRLELSGVTPKTKRPELSSSDPTTKHATDKEEEVEYQFATRRCNLEKKYIQKPEVAPQPDLDFQFARSRTPMRDVGEKTRAVITEVSPKERRRAEVKIQNPLLTGDRKTAVDTSRATVVNKTSQNKQPIVLSPERKANSKNIARQAPISQDSDKTTENSREDVAAMVSRKLGLSYHAETSPQKTDSYNSHSNTNSFTINTGQVTKHAYDDRDLLKVDYKFPKSQSFDDANVKGIDSSQTLRASTSDYNLSSDRSPRRRRVRNVGSQEDARKNIESTALPEKPSISVIGATPSFKSTRGGDISDTGLKKAPFVDNSSLSMLANVDSGSRTPEISPYNVTPSFRNDSSVSTDGQRGQALNVAKTSTPVPPQELLTPKELKSLSPGEAGKYKHRPTDSIAKTSTPLPNQELSTPKELKLLSPVEMASAKHKPNVQIENLTVGYVTGDSKTDNVQTALNAFPVLTDRDASSLSEMKQQDSFRDLALSMDAEDGADAPRKKRLLPSIPSDEHSRRGYVWTSDKSCVILNNSDMTPATVSKEQAASVVHTKPSKPSDLDIGTGVSNKTKREKASRMDHDHPATVNDASKSRFVDDNTKSSKTTNEQAVSMTSSLNDDIATLNQPISTPTDFDDIFMHSSRYLEQATSDRKESSSEDAEKDRMSRSSRFRRSLKQRKCRSKSHSRVDDDAKKDETTLAQRSKSRDRVSETQDWATDSNKSQQPDTMSLPGNEAGNRELFSRKFLSGLSKSKGVEKPDEQIDNQTTTIGKKSLSKIKSDLLPEDATKTCPPISGTEEAEQSYQTSRDTCVTPGLQAVANQPDSDSTAASLTDSTSDVGLKKRKDKSTLRKSRLNTAQDTEATASPVQDLSSLAKPPLPPASLQSPSIHSPAPPSTQAASFNTPLDTASGSKEVHPEIEKPTQTAYEPVSLADVSQHPSLTDSPLNTKKLSSIRYSRAQQFTNLLKKFSGSESSSENDSVPTQRRKSTTYGVYGQLTDEVRGPQTRRTPERTQSLRERVRKFEQSSSSSSDSASKVARSASVKAGDVRGQDVHHQGEVARLKGRVTEANVIGENQDHDDRGIPRGISDSRTWVEPLNDVRVTKNVNDDAHSEVSDTKQDGCFKKPSTLSLTAQEKKCINVEKRLVTPDTPDTSTLSISEISIASSNLDNAFEWLCDFDDSSVDVDLDKIGLVSPITEEAPLEKVDSYIPNGQKERRGLGCVSSASNVDVKSSAGDSTALAADKTIADQFASVSDLSVAIADIPDERETKSHVESDILRRDTNQRQGHTTPGVGRGDILSETCATARDDNTRSAGGKNETSDITRVESYREGSTTNRDENDSIKRVEDQTCDDQTEDTTEVNSVKTTTMHQGDGDDPSSVDSTAVTLRPPKDRPIRGILKRSSSDINRWSLNEPGNVDPELASLLRARRDEQTDSSDDGTEADYAEDTRDKIRKEIKDTQEEGSEPAVERRLSMSERIYQIQTRIEESLSTSTTPKLRSGGITPKQISIDADLAVSSASAVLDSGELAERLETVAGRKGETVEERRAMFQRRSHDDWRSKTHPVTLEEIEQAGSLHAVSNFRKLVNQKSLENALDTTKISDKPPHVPTEFPRAFQKEKVDRRSAARFKTAPITAEELNAIPEDSIDPLREKTGGLLSGATSKTDSGIISSSETDVRADDPEGSDPALLSLSARMLMFKRMEEDVKVDTVAKREVKRDKTGETRSLGARWFIQRKKRERSQTLPVTEGELKDASLFSKNDATGSGAGDSKTEEESTVEDEDVSRLSVLEKMKLFTERKEIVESPSPGEHTPRRRNRKLSSRFKTQPVTPEELKKAQSHISPLAMSLVAPPDPDTLLGLSVRDQVVMMARHAEQTLVSGKHKPPGQEHTPGQAAEGILKSSDKPSSSTTDTQADVRGILRHDLGSAASCVDAHVGVERKGILKPDDPTKSPSEPRGILKRGDSFEQNASSGDDGEIRGILKSSEVSAEDVSYDDIHSILKTPETSDWDAETSSDVSHGILKLTDNGGADLASQTDCMRSILKHSDGSSASKDNSRQNSPRGDTDSPRSILKRLSLPENVIAMPEKGVLKHGSGSRERLTSPEKSSLKRSSVTEFNSPDRSALRTDYNREHLLPEKSALKRNSLQEQDFAIAALLDKKPESILKKSDFPDISRTPSKGILKKDSFDKGSEVSGNLDSSVSTAPNMSALFSLSTITNVSTDVVSSSDESFDISASFTARTPQERSPDTYSLDAVSSAPSSSRSPESKSLGSISTDTQSPGSPEEYKLGTSEEESEVKSEEKVVKRQGSRGGNDAVQRRRVAKDLRKSQAERYLTQPPEARPEVSELKKTRYGTARHFTQPVTPEEKQVAEEHTPNSSILDRVNSLKKRGDEEWKRRIAKNLDLEFDQSKEERQATRSSIADRLNKLGAAQQGWQNRVTESDAKAFTVEGKLEKIKPGLSPITLGNDGTIPDIKDPGPLLSPPREKIPVPKELIFSDEPLPRATVTPASLKQSVAEPEKVEQTYKVVEVPSIDESLVESFFASSRNSDDFEKIDVTIDDFDDLFLKGEDVLQPAIRIRPKRRHQAQTRNPLKTMSVQTQNEYTETTSGVAEREVRRLKRATIAKDATLAQSMLAEAAVKGLQAKESFSVELRKVTKDSSTPGKQVRHDPYKEIMLLQVKGRRQVQTRLVEPCAQAINSGDCFILITPDLVFNWIGQYSNVIEKSKSAELAAYIQQKKDLGFKGDAQVHTIEEPNTNRGTARAFWEALGGFSKYQEAGPIDEDLTYESHLTDTNMIYRLSNNTLVPYEEYWGNLPKHEMLSSQEVLVMDFGSELYVWTGSKVSMDERKVGVKLAKQLWERGFDYSMCNINPLYPLRCPKEDATVTKCGTARPSWSLFGKVNQNMETVLFREKFVDWPDTSRLLRMKRQVSKDTVTAEISDLQAYDAKLMMPEKTEPVTLVLEGSNVGRGQKWIEDLDGITRVREIQTLGVGVWHVREYDRVELVPESYGQFHDGDTYVVRWQYMITAAGMKTLKGTSSTRHCLMGRERCAYFFWQGVDSTINEKGASALMTVELDEERGPQVRVEQGTEPPCFMNLFHGSAVIHRGKREDAATNTQGPWRFYALRGELGNEMCLMEIEKSITNLRSRSSYLLLNLDTGALSIWHGSKSSDATRKNAKTAANNIKSRCPEEVGLHESCVVTINEVNEGSERRDWWTAMGTRQQRDLYLSLHEETTRYTHSPRLFHMESISGEFVATEVLYSLRNTDFPSPMPFLQSQLYMVEQPTLFLLDNDREVYLWQGWWPDPSDDQENVQTGSAHTRFIADRRCALETTLQYCKEKNSRAPPKAWLVFAGVEPLAFTNLFPFWCVDEVVRDKACQSGHSDGETVDAAVLLDKMTNSRYTFAQLMERPLPDYVDPMRLETYLTDTEFYEVIKLTREEFGATPGWKQIKLKRELGLF